MKISAKAIPNDRYKHYGTTIELTVESESTRFTQDIVIWIPRGPAVDGDEHYDGHYESVLERDVVDALVERINS